VVGHRSLATAVKEALVAATGGMMKSVLTAMVTFLVFTFGLVTSIATTEIVQEWSLTAVVGQAGHQGAHGRLILPERRCNDMACNRR
jgi:hypothetical protein